MPKLDRHSKLVGIFMVALPLVGLALMATLFLVARRVDPETAIPYAKIDVEDLLRDPRMTAPAYAGTTADGTAITMTAKAARPAADNQEAAASEIAAEMDFGNGSQVSLSASAGELAKAAGELRLTNGVLIKTSSDYQLSAPGIVVNLDRSGLESRGEGILAEGPIGKIEAQSFSLHRQNGGAQEAAALLVFSGGVKLVYLPPQ